MQTFLFGYLDSPKLDESLEESAHNQYELHRGDFHSTVIGHQNDYLNRKVRIEGKVETGNTYKTVILGDELLAWSKKNLSQKIFDIRMSRSDPGNSWLSAHADISRKYTILYPIRTGGPYAINCIYFDRTVSCIVPKNLTMENCYQEDYNQLETVAQIQIPLRTWVVMNARVMHGLENINEGRIVIHASLDDISDLKIRHPVYYG